MSEEGMNYLKLEYEHLYNLRDQSMLFLNRCPSTTGITEELVTWLDSKVNLLVDELAKEE